MGAIHPLDSKKNNTEWHHDSDSYRDSRRTEKKSHFSITDEVPEHAHAAAPMGPCGSPCLAPSSALIRHRVVTQDRRQRQVWKARGSCWPGPNQQDSNQLKPSCKPQQRQQLQHCRYWGGSVLHIIPVKPLLSSPDLLLWTELFQSLPV